MSDATLPVSREAIVARLRALLAEQEPLMNSLLPEARRWARLGLDIPTGFCLAFADAPAVFERIRQLDHELQAQLRQLEQIDPSGPQSSDLVSRMRWAIGLQRDAR